MILKIKSAFNLFILCFLIILSSCEAEKEVFEKSESEKKLKREISFEQFKNEINQPNFSKKMSFSNSSTARTIADFEVDTTLVKAYERNFITYTLKLDPKFEATDSKFYNLVVYRDNTNELVKQIIEYLPHSELNDSNQEGIYNFLQIATKEVIYSSRMSSLPFCVTVVWEEVCTCAGHTRAENCDCHSFHSQAHLEVVPCPTGGGSEPDYQEPTPNVPNNPYGNQSGGGGDSNDNGEIALDPVLPTANRSNCNDLKEKSSNQEFKDKMNELKNDSGGTTGEKAFETFANSPKY